MATTVEIEEAEIHLSQLVDRAANGEEIIIAKAGQPVARLLPAKSVTGNPRKAGWGSDLLKDANLDALFDSAVDQELQNRFLNGLISPE